MTLMQHALQTLCVEMCQGCWYTTDINVNEDVLSCPYDPLT